LIAAADSWALIADRNHLKSLYELEKVISALYRFDTDQYFRGFDVNHFQENFGIKSSTQIGNRFKYKSAENPISFTTDIRIARGFGSNVVSSTLSECKLLHFTRELEYLICKRRNIALETQKEVILLPPYEIELILIERNENKPFFTLW
jgi:hypothetical protein